MVRRLLPLSLGVLLTWGCILSNPPDYDVGSHPPVIQQYLPSEDLTPIKTDSGSLTTRFRVEITDEDLGEELLFRWYLNFDPDAEGCGCLDSGLMQNQGGGLYWDVINLTISSLKQRTCNRLTVVVADGEWLDGHEDDLGCPQVAEGVNRVSNNWWLGAYDESFSLNDISWSACDVLDIPLTDPAEEPPP
jgi:hypothetical protein